jgi:hypothetical protein
MIDYNNLERTIVINGFGKIPEVGGLISGITGVLWPATKEDVWKDIKANVEALINEKLDDALYNNVCDILSGLKLDMDYYLESATDNESKITGEKFVSVQSVFLAHLPLFKSSGHEFLLLPLFTQFANLHLSLMRDGVLFGLKWGWSDSDVNHLKKDLKSYIKSYTDYCNTIYNNALQNIIDNTPGNGHNTEPFLTINRFVREMTLSVLDFKNMWMYYDPTIYPGPIKINLSREIYSDPMGTSDDSGPVRINLSVNNEMSKIEVWGWDVIDACVVEYTAPNGYINPGNTGRMGDVKTSNWGGTNQGPWGFVLDNGTPGYSWRLVGNPVVEATAYSGTRVNSIILKQKDGNVVSAGGKIKFIDGETGSPLTFSYPDEILSSIKIMGISKFYNTADCVIFGFKFPNSPDSIDNPCQVFTNVSNRLFNKNEELISPYHDGVKH